MLQGDIPYWQHWFVRALKYSSSDGYRLRCSLHYSDLNFADRQVLGSTRIGSVDPITPPTSTMMIEMINTVKPRGKRQTLTTAKKRRSINTVTKNRKNSLRGRVKISKPSLHVSNVIYKCRQRRLFWTPPKQNHSLRFGISVCHQTLLCDLVTDFCKIKFVELHCSLHAPAMTFVIIKIALASEFQYTVSKKFWGYSSGICFSVFFCFMSVEVVVYWIYLIH